MPARTLENVISGRSRTAGACAVRAILSPLSLLYAGAAGLKNLAYDTGLVKPARLGIPVISVGNLTTGGTGKTPLAAAIIARLTARGLRTALLARSYGAGPDRLNDELTMIKRRFPDVLICPGRDRVAAGRLAEAQGADVAVMDDGFQHRRLHRDLDILTVDAGLPGRLRLTLPAGPYRELWRNRRRAHAIVLTKCTDRLPVRPVEPSGTGQIVVRTAHAPTHLEWADTRCDIGRIRDRAVFLACGIGDPQSFAAAAEQAGARVTGTCFFPDHYAYTAADAARIAQLARQAGAQTVLTTEKDMVKLIALGEMAENDIEFLALCITIQFLSDDLAFWGLIDAACAH